MNSVPPSARIEAVQSAGYLVLSNALSSRSKVPELKSGHTSILRFSSRRITLLILLTERLPVAPALVQMFK
jgi:hypothetical protein